MIKSSTLAQAADYFHRLEQEIASLRFCRNVQSTTETDEKENERRLLQLLEAVDRLLKVAA